MDISSHAASLLPSTDSINRQANQHSPQTGTHLATTDTRVQHYDHPLSVGEPSGNEPVLNDNLNEVTAQIEKFMNSMQRGLAFSIDEKSGNQVVSVLDKLSGEVIRQIPSEEMLVIARQMADKAAGILLNTEV
ncbi:MAG: flagellar protein FlaG [Plesiomonas sp.]